MASESAAAESALANMALGTAILALAAFLLFALLLWPVAAAAARRVVSWSSARALKNVLGAGGRPVLHDFIIPGACGGLTRIDHAVMTGRGIVCVTHRPYRGNISGRCDDAQWQSKWAGCERRFLNPLARNDAQVAALKNILPGIAIAGVVVFHRAAQHVGERPARVLLPQEFDGTIESLEFDGPELADPNVAWLSLESAAQTDDASRRDLDAQLSFG